MFPVMMRFDPWNQVIFVLAPFRTNVCLYIIGVHYITPGPTAAWRKWWSDSGLAFLVSNFFWVSEIRTRPRCCSILTLFRVLNNVLHKKSAWDTFYVNVGKCQKTCSYFCRRPRGIWRRFCLLICWRLTGLFPPSQQSVFSSLWLIQQDALDFI